MQNSKTNSPWVLVDINQVVYAISCNVVLSLNQVPQITPLPKSPQEIRGVIDFRSHTIELLDTRTLLGLSPISQDIQEFFELMEQRYKDHTNWLATLEQTVIEDKEFTLTTDPHKCAFGKWYDNYNFENTNIMFSTAFSRFDAPHKAIHNIAIVAKEFIDKGEKQQAMDLIQSTKDKELKQMLHLFDDIKRAYKDSRKEIVVVIGDENQCIGLSVDQIVAIEYLFEIDENLIKDSITSTQYLEGLGKRKDGSAVLLVNDEYILNNYKQK